MTITKTTTKEQLTQYLRSNLNEVRKSTSKGAKEVLDTLNYALKNIGKAKKSDLIDLVKSVDALLVIPASADEKPKATLTKSGTSIAKKKAEKKEDKPIENSLKKSAKAESVKEEPKKVEKVEKKAPKKADALKEEPKKEVKPTKSAEVDIDKFTFPEEITLEVEEGESTYVLAKGIKTFKDLVKYLEKEDNKPLVFAFPFTKKSAKLADYGFGMIPIPKDGFPNNLDICIPTYVGSTNDVCIIASLYTDCPYTIIGDREIEEIDGARYVVNWMYNIYVEK